MRTEPVHCAYCGKRVLVRVDLDVEEDYQCDECWLDEANAPGTAKRFSEWHSLLGQRSTTKVSRARAAAKPQERCPYCGQVLYVDENGTFECGGEGEGICSIWSAIGDYQRTVRQLPASAALNVDHWIDEWVVEAVGQSWNEIGWDRELHLRGIREHAKESAP